MKKLYTLVSIVIFFGCTKEQQQQKQENLVIQAMVTGQWKVTNFTKGAADVTADFSMYKFQFKSNLTVDAINNGNVERSGTWNADANAKTITSGFVNAAEPLVLLNGVWTIQTTTWTSVLAIQTVNGEVRSLRLDKQ